MPGFEPRFAVLETAVFAIRPHRYVAAAARFELATFRFEAERSIRLSYAAVLLAALPPSKRALHVHWSGP